MLQEAIANADLVAAEEDAKLLSSLRAFKGLFRQQEVAELAKGMDMSTIDPSELVKRRPGMYEFSRTLVFRPRDGLSGDMLDAMNHEPFASIRDHQSMLEYVVGQKIFPPGVREVNLRMVDAIFPFSMIAGFAATGILLPIAAIGLYNRCRARIGGMSFTLRGVMDEPAKGVPVSSDGGGLGTGLQRAQLRMGQGSVDRSVFNGRVDFMPRPGTVEQQDSLGRPDSTPNLLSHASACDCQRSTHTEPVRGLVSSPHLTPRSKQRVRVEKDHTV